MISMLALYSDNRSLNPADAFSFFVKFVFEKNENKQNDAVLGPFLKKPFEPLTKQQYVIYVRNPTHGMRGT